MVLERRVHVNNGQGIVTMANQSFFRTIAFKILLTVVIVAVVATSITVPLVLTNRSKNASPSSTTIELIQTNTETSSNPSVVTNTVTATTTTNLIKTTQTNAMNHNWTESSSPSTITVFSSTSTTNKPATTTSNETTQRTTGSSSGCTSTIKSTITPSALQSTTNNLMMTTTTTDDPTPLSTTTTITTPARTTTWMNEETSEFSLLPSASRSTTMTEETTPTSTTTTEITTTTPINEENTSRSTTMIDTSTTSTATLFSAVASSTSKTDVSNGITSIDSGSVSYIYNDKTTFPETGITNDVAKTDSSLEYETTRWTNVDNTITTSPSTSTTNTSTLPTTTKIMPPTNLLVNPGAETGSITGWQQQGLSNVIVDSGQMNDGYNPRTGRYCFAGGPGPGSPSQLFQKVNLLGGIQNFTTQQLDSNRLRVHVRFFYQTYDTFFMRNDKVQVTVSFQTDSSTIPALTSGELACSPSPGWCVFERYLALPPRTRSIDYTMEFYRRDVIGSAIDCYIDDNWLAVS